MLAGEVQMKGAVAAPVGVIGRERERGVEVGDGLSPLILGPAMVGAAGVGLGALIVGKIAARDDGIAKGKPPRLLGIALAEPPVAAIIVVLLVVGERRLTNEQHRDRQKQPTGHEEP